MQSGLIRRVDELGRVVIPRQIRRQLSVEKGGLLEFAVKNDIIVMRRFSPLNKLQSRASVILNTLAQSENALVALITPLSVVYSTQELPSCVTSNLALYAREEKVFEKEKEEELNILSLPLREKEYLGSLILAGSNIVENERILFAARLLLTVFNN